MVSKMKTFRGKKKKKNCGENENEHFIHITITVSAQTANDCVLFRQIPSILQTFAATTKILAMWSLSESTGVS